MGQKVSPIGMRVGVIRDWESRWYAEKDYGTLLMEDVKIREFLLKELHAAYVSRIEIERSKNRVEIIIRAARPGVIIGSNGESIEILKKKLQKMCAGKQIHIIHIISVPCGVLHNAFDPRVFPVPCIRGLRCRKL